jgi:uncharacterized protein YyaL (SSP411 family)
VIIRGDGEPAQRLRDIATAVYAPRRMTFVIPADAPALPPALAAKPPRRNAPLAWLCTGMHCSAPLEDESALAQALAGT